jgi:hypothetical protein
MSLWIADMIADIIADISQSIADIALGKSFSMVAMNSNRDSVTALLHC